MNRREGSRDHLVEFDRVPKLEMTCTPPLTSHALQPKQSAAYRKSRRVKCNAAAHASCTGHQDTETPTTGMYMRQQLLRLQPTASYNQQSQGPDKHTISTGTVDTNPKCYDCKPGCVILFVDVTACVKQGKLFTRSIIRNPASPRSPPRSPIVVYRNP